MPERRSYARKKRRFLVEFQVQGSPCTGFTYDVSPSGIFVRSARLPQPGAYMTANLHLSERATGPYGAIEVPLRTALDLDISALGPLDSRPTPLRRAV